MRNQTIVQTMRYTVKQVIRDTTLDDYPDNLTEKLAEKYLKKDGKRHRPFLLLAAYRTLSGKTTLDEAVKSAIIAIECLHKASLIHDDIEDYDSFRNGYPTLHVEISVPAALNVGDYLAGLGGRFLVESDINDTDKISMLKMLADTQRRLCVGQGNDLAFRDHKTQITLKELLDIYRNKTSSLFLLAFHCGALLSGRCDTLVESAIEKSSEALGIAYQLKDDLEDRDKNSSELSILNILTRSQAEELLCEYIDKALSGLDDLDNGLLKESYKDVIGES